MTAVAERPVAPLVDASTAPARRRRPAYLAVLGILVAAALVGATALILLSFSGAFTNYAAVTAEVPASSTAVPLDSPVEYRNVSVGKVTDSGSTSANGLIRLSLHINPSQLSHIPADVRATVAPESIFGNQYVVLQAPARPTTTTLRAGAVIPALLTNQTASLQTTLGDLDRLLTDLHPQLFDASLTAIAGALQGQGYHLGATLVKAHTYLGAMQPLWPQVVADLQTLVPVANTVQQSTPALVATLGNLEAPSATVSGAGSAQIQALFANGSTLAGQASQLLGAIQQPFAVLAAASGPFLDDLSGASSHNPQEIAQIFAGLSTWASTWTAAEQSGPYLNLTATIQVANPADLGLALLGGPEASTDLAEGLGAGYVNPPTYASAAVPQVLASASRPGRAAGVTVAGGTATGSTSTGGTAGVAAVMPEPAQEAAVVSIVRGMTGAPPASPAVATLLLGPVLDHLVGAR